MSESTLQPFEFKGNQLRILTDKQGGSWFVAKDVCNILGLSNTAVTIKALDEDELSNSYITDSLGRKQTSFIISEPGLYKLIMRSRKPEAKEFQRWVSHEVLPSIRKHGAYMTEPTLEQAITNPDFLIRLATELKTEKQKRAEAEQTIKEQKPKVLFADAVATSKRSILIGELAKILKQNGYDTGQNRFFKTLRADGLLMKRNGNPNMPTQKAMQLKLFEVKETAIQRPDGHTTVNFTNKVTPKGQQYLIEKYLGCMPLDLEQDA